jgi:F-type H+-transporting ATPase subunit a
MLAFLQPIQEHAAEGAAAAAQEPLNVGEAILEHVANSPIGEPLIRLPKIFGIDFSVTKHVFMLWLVSATVFVVLTWITRRHLKREGAPTGLGNLLEYFVEFVRDGIALPNFGKKWVNTWTPLVLTLFVFIFSANLIGMIPIFETLNVANHFVVHADHESFFGKLIHGSTTATGNFNVTAALATITFFAIIVAGSKAHGFGKHIKNIVPHGLPLIIYAILIPIEVLGLFVKPFALTMRLAANMTGGHIAMMAVLSLGALFMEMFKSAIAGLAVSVALSVPLAVGLSALELIVVLVQAYVFTLLSATFIGMAIHVHH